MSNQPHGVRARYIAGCRCEPCATAHARYCKRYKWRTNRGEIITVPIEEVREHLAPLLDRASLSSIALAADMSSGHLCHILDGSLRRIHHATAARLMAVSIDDIAGTQWVSALGMKRRVQALSRLGWTLAEIDRAAGGYGKSNILRVLDGRREYVTADTHRRFVDVFDAMSMRLPVGVTNHERGGITRARKRAEREGWPPPLAWDDIDDPNEQPKGGLDADDHRSREDVDEATVLRVLDGDNLPTTVAEKREIVRRWRAAGHPLNELERRTGWQVNRYGKGNAA